MQVVVWAWLDTPNAASSGRCKRLKVVWGGCETKFFKLSFFGLLFQACVPSIIVTL
jgi:hypothetical protein